MGDNTIINVILTPEEELIVHFSNSLTRQDYKITFSLETPVTLSAFLECAKLAADSYIESLLQQDSQE